MSTYINVTVGKAGLSDKAKQQTNANRQAKLEADARSKAEVDGKRQRDANRAQQGIGPDGKPLFGQPLQTAARKDEPAAFRQDAQGLNLGHLWLFNKETYKHESVWSFQGTGTWGGSSVPSSMIGYLDILETPVPAAGSVVIDTKLACGTGAVWQQLASADLQESLEGTSSTTIYSNDNRWSYVLVTIPPPSGLGASTYVYEQTGVFTYTEVAMRTVVFPGSGGRDHQSLYFALPAGKGVFVFIHASKSAWSLCKETGYYYTIKEWGYPFGRIDSDITLSNGSVLTPSMSGDGGEYANSAWGPGPNIMRPLRESVYRMVPNASAAEGYTEELDFEISNDGYISHEWLSKGDRFIEVYVGANNSLRKIAGSIEECPNGLRAVLNAAFPAPTKTLSVDPPDLGEAGSHRGNSYRYPGIIYDINSTYTGWMYSQDDGFNTSPYPGVVFTPSIFKYINDNLHQFTDTANTKTWNQVKTMKRFATQNLGNSSAYGDNPGCWTAQELYGNAKAFKHDLWGVKGQDISAVDPWDAYLPGWTGAQPINKPKFNFTMSEDRQAVPADYDQWSEFVTVWDWDEPGYCRQMCLALGFTEADLTP